MPTTIPDTAQVSASTPDNAPSWVFDSGKSSRIIGARNDSACRSKNTKPNDRNRISSSRFW
ncbi:hypothetical protein [Saccharopolyspora hirsuta]|uniref:hypothetical protein n=1 Tax=Saccharopolyspora hirsuta TaxID=1837 RepID=UPI001FEBC7BA|nr:hypothetical protein [Saccharopolyspora hirsuta]